MTQTPTPAESVAVTAAGALIDRDAAIDALTKALWPNPQSQPTSDYSLAMRAICSVSRLSATPAPPPVNWRIMLERCAEKFRFYERSHRAKGTEDADAKAEVNADMVRQIEMSLASPSATPAPGEEVEALCKRLEAHVDSGRRTMGGGSISYDGKSEMWGNEPIMVLRNPDGPEAAKLLRQTLATPTPDRERVLREALETAQAQLAKAADQFAFYADEHAKKKTPDGDAKGAVNHQWALACAKVDHVARQALATEAGEG